MRYSYKNLIVFSSTTGDLVDFTASWAEALFHDAFGLLEESFPEDNWLLGVPFDYPSLDDVTLRVGFAYCC